MSADRKSLYRFDDYCLDSVKRLLLRGGEAVQLTPKAVAILLELVERRGEVVTKADLIRRVWTDVYVSEGNLTQNVFALRKALGDTANEARYVVTVPGLGYSFVAAVEEVPREDSSSGVFPVLRLLRLPPGGSAAADPRPPSAAASPGSSKRRLRWVLGAAALAAAVAVAAGLVRWPLGAARPPAPLRPCVAVFPFSNLSERPGDAWLGSALAEMLITELASDPGVRIVSGGEASRQGGDPLRSLPESLGAERVVSGAYLVTPAGAAGTDSRIRLDLRVVRAPDGEILKSVTVTGSEAELFDLVARAGAELRRDLGLDQPRPAAMAPPPFR